MGGIRTIAINFALIGLFALAMITFGIQLAQDNSASQSIADDPEINKFKSNLSSNINNYNDDANDTQTSFGKDTPISGAFTPLNSVNSIWKSMVRLPKLIYQLTLGLVFDKIFGNSFAAVFNMITALVIVIIIMYAWQWIRGGSAG